MREVLFAALLVPAACSAVPTPPAAPAATAAAPGTCRTEGLDRFVGQRRSPEAQSQLLAASGARIIRWVEHGMMVTMDFLEDRLTVRLGPDHRIVSLGCG